MTADTEAQAPAMEQGNATKSSRTAKRKSAARTAAAKRGRKPAGAGRAARSEASNRSSESGSRKSARSRSATGGAQGRKSTKTAKSQSATVGSGSRSRPGVASRILTRGRRAASNAYDWASEGASRALPLAVRSMPDQRIVQKLVDERPYMLGALGLGIGAMIGLMLPSPLTAMSRGASATGRSGGAPRRRS